MQSAPKFHIHFPLKNLVWPFYGLDHLLIWAALLLVWLVFLYLVKTFSLFGLFPVDKRALFPMTIVGSVLGSFLATAAFAKTVLHITDCNTDRLTSRRRIISNVKIRLERMRYIETKSDGENIRFDYTYSKFESYFAMKNWFILINNEKSEQSIRIVAPRFVNKRLIRRLREGEE